MTLLQAYGLSSLAVLAYVALLWVVSLILRDASIVDIFWGLGYVLLATFHYIFGGDWQLSRFKRDPANKGQVLDTGLWAWTRHPNYFGDATVWWGFYLLALGTRRGWWTVYSPILMTVLLLRV